MTCANAQLSSSAPSHGSLCTAMPPTSCPTAPLSALPVAGLARSDVPALLHDVAVLPHAPQTAHRPDRDPRPAACLESGALAEEIVPITVEKALYDKDGNR